MHTDTTFLDFPVSLVSEQLKSILTEILLLILQKTYTIICKVHSPILEVTE